MPPHTGRWGGSYVDTLGFVNLHQVTFWTNSIVDSKHYCFILGRFEYTRKHYWEATESCKSYIKKMNIYILFFYIYIWTSL